MHADRKAVWAGPSTTGANSAFATTVMAGFFPVFFKQYWSHGADVNLSTAQLALGNSVAGIAMALLAPVLGAVADPLRRHQAPAPALRLPRGPGDRSALLGRTRLLAVGHRALCHRRRRFSGANVFYDALLPSVAPAGRLDTVSSLGYALGYLGGGCSSWSTCSWPPAPSGSASRTAPRRCAWPSSRWRSGGRLQPVHARLGAEPGAGQARPGVFRAVADGLRELRGTVARLRSYGRPSSSWPPTGATSTGWTPSSAWRRLRPVARVPGIGSHRGAADRAVRRLPGRIAFGRMGQRLGPRRAIFIGIAVYMGVTVWGSGDVRPDGVLRHGRRDRAGAGRGPGAQPLLLRGA